MVVYTANSPDIKIPNLDITSFLFRNNSFNTVRSKTEPVLIDGLDGKTLSHLEVKDISEKVAVGWKEKVGLGKGDVVAVFAPNQYDHAALYFSVLSAGCTVSPGNPSYTETEFNHQIHKSQAKALVTVPELIPILTKVASANNIPKERIFLFGNKTVDGFKPYKSLASDIGNRQFPLQTVNPSEDLAFICFSSGTTGVAKGVMLTHTNFVSQMLLVTEFEGTDPNQKDDRIIGFLPFYHIFGLTTLVLRAFYSVTPVVIIPKYDLERVCQLIEKYKITIGPIVPPVAVHFAKSPVVPKYDLSSLRFISSGAAPLGREHIEALNLRIKAPVRQGYGLTETTAGCMYQRIGISPSGSSGVLVPNMELKLVDEEGRELGADQPGEVLFRGPVIMKGYLNDDKANAETFADGWLRTGDVAKYDSATGEFFILDRIKELIKFKGFQVAPAELEALLMSHDKVADCCVVGVYDSAQATELPRAYVVLQEGVHKNSATIKEIDEFVNSNVVQYKKLRGGIRLIDQVPKSPSGKILRREVREWVKKEQSEEKVKASL
ncbi:acetyl-CoA synthetase-like protein [Backusella circina FSU 941]|nr:acetyl-CoA synthetase-like protein [Backusella circina FSU 941]